MLLDAISLSFRVFAERACAAVCRRACPPFPTRPRVGLNGAARSAAMKAGDRDWSGQNCERGASAPTVGVRRDALISELRQRREAASPFLSITSCDRHCRASAACRHRQKGPGARSLSARDVRCNGVDSNDHGCAQWLRRSQVQARSFRGRAALVAGGGAAPARPMRQLACRFPARLRFALPPSSHAWHAVQALSRRLVRRLR